MGTMRHAIILAGLLIATPAIAEDGTYQGGTDLKTVYAPCWGSAWTFTVDGDRVKAEMIPASTGKHSVSFVGEIQVDGWLKMSSPTSFGNRRGTVYVEGKFTDGSFEGVTYSNDCHARLMATKSSS
jgi:hypothetical protein